MGLLTTGGLPLKWGTEQNDEAIRYVIEHGVEQFLRIYDKKKSIAGSPFVWGDELEHHLVKIEPDNVRLSLNAAKAMETCNSKGRGIWHHEYGSFMCESIPNEPHGLTVASLRDVEVSMQSRMAALDEFAGPDTVGMTLVTFPLMGTQNFITSDNKDAPFSESLFVPDVCINSSHPRFGNLTRNIRLRRGRKVCIQIPLFVDKFTLEKTVDPRLNIDFHPNNSSIECLTEKSNPKGKRFSQGPDEDEKHEEQRKRMMTHLYTPASDYYYAQYNTSTSREALVKKRHDACPCPVPSVQQPCIYMDCMAFGMGCNCLQVTMQLADVMQARDVYDQLAVLCPVFLALTAGTPFQKGLLSNSDVRWMSIAASVDDRRRDEVPRIIKSRYDSISTFISATPNHLQQFNDSRVEVNEKYFNYLIKKDVDSRLARHIAHLFIRDPLVVFDQMIQLDDNVNTLHFENVQSTNWQTVRFKPPPVDGDIGWRVEFRVMEVLPTAFENAAFAVFIALLTNAIIKYKPNFYTKISIVDENMGKAHLLDPCSQKYTFRKDIFAKEVSASDEEVDLFSVNEIMNGGATFFGLIPLVRRYMKEEKLEDPKLQAYIKFISMRASGAIPTTAQYLRQFILKHPEYKQDSRISPVIAKDIVERIHGLASGTMEDASYLPMNIFFSNKRERE